MSLLSTDLRTVKKLSLKGVRLPIKDKEPEPINYPPSPEEISYSKLVAINPLIEELVDRFNLVSNTTGKRIRKIDPHPEPEINKLKLIDLAKVLLKGETSYSKEEIINLIKIEIGIDIYTAETGFNLMRDSKIIKLAKVTGLYYLQGSTPF